MDSDFGKKDNFFDNERLGKCKKQNTKKRVKLELEKNGGKVWISDGREVENYISETMYNGYIDSKIKIRKKIWKNNYNKFGNLLKLSKKATGNKNDSVIEKVEFANWIVGKKYPLENFECDLKSKIELYSELIKKWNS